jgi:cation:H+ antiporter
MAFELLWFIIGIILLVKFSDLTIQNAVKLSHKSGISKMAIGFILIAVATSLPELAIAITSSIKHEGLLSFGNLIGANVTNLTLIFGLMAIFGLRLNNKDAEKSVIALLAATIIGVFVLVLGGVDFAFGIFLVIIFYAFSRMVMKEGVNIKNMDRKERVHGLISRYLVYLLISVFIVVLAANVVTDTAIILATQLGISEALIGATILAMGTTLPELSVGIAAVRRRNVELAVGNALGSVITNITLVLGVAAIINPIIIGMVSSTALVSMIIVNLIFLYFVSRRTFRAIEGILLWAMYVFYIMAMLMIGAL